MWTLLKNAIASVIKPNDNQEITGQALQSTLNNIVNVIGENATFAGAATPATAPGEPDGPVFYLAATPGNYVSFGSISLTNGEIAALRNTNNGWIKSTITKIDLDEIRGKLDSSVKGLVFDFQRDYVGLWVQHHNEDFDDADDTQLPCANKNAAGFMSANDKVKLDSTDESVKGLVFDFQRDYVGFWVQRHNGELDSESALPCASKSGAGFMSANDKVKLESMGEELEAKAPKVGYAPDLKVDFAKELVGRGAAEYQEIGAIRPTGLISIGDGNATIESIKGNSVVWNQLLSNHDFSKGLEGWSAGGGASLSLNDDQSVRLSIIGGGYNQDIRQYTTLPVGHKMYISIVVRTAEALSAEVILNGDNRKRVALKGGVKECIDLIISVNNILYNDVRLLSVPQSYTSPTDIDIYETAIVDLTQMFGAGKEPTTVEEYRARRPLGVPYDYNEGEIISYDAEELKSVGFNAWDEEWEVGGLSSGKPTNTISQIRSKNYTPCVGGQDYYGYMGWSTDNFLHLSLYDKDKVHIGNVGVNRKVVTLPTNASYFKMFTLRECGYGSIYKHDICINLSHSGYRNGEYKSYEADTLQLPDVKAIKDKDGTQLFPYGLLSAGSVHDEITATKAIKRIGVIDIGTLKWFSLSNIKTFYTEEILNAKKQKGYNKFQNILLRLYNKVGAYDYGTTFTEKSDKTYCLDAFVGNVLNIRDSSYTDATTFKQAMQGVLLYYELAEPIEVDLPEPMNLTYDAWDFGTEELIAEGKTTPLNADIVYQFNAVDRIRENTAKNQALEKELAVLKEQLTQLIQVNNQL